MTTQTLGGVAKFRFIARLGRGGMADVFLASAPGLANFNKLLVVKLLQDFTDPGAIELFLHEARTSARLAHPNIVQTYEVGEDGDQYFMVMEYLDGMSLNLLSRKVLRESQKPIPEPIALSIVSEVLAGLAYAHEITDFDGRRLGLVHRDLTPHNVMLTRQGEVKVLDFGIAKTVDSQQVTEAGTYRGKVAYIAPEHARGEVLDGRADLFSVGAMLCELLAGQGLWGEVTGPALITRLFGGSIPTLQSVMPHAPLPLQRITQHALAARREDRYPTAAEFKRELDQFILATYGTITRQKVADWAAAYLTEQSDRLQALVNQQLTQQPTSLEALRSGTPGRALPVFDQAGTPSPVAASAIKSDWDLISAPAPTTPGSSDSGLRAPPRSSDSAQRLPTTSGSGIRQAPSDSGKRLPPISSGSGVRAAAAPGSDSRLPPTSSSSGLRAVAPSIPPVLAPSTSGLNVPPNPFRSPEELIKTVELPPKPSAAPPPDLEKFEPEQATTLHYQDEPPEPPDPWAALQNVGDRPEPRPSMPNRAPTPAAPVRQPGLGRAGLFVVVGVAVSFAVGLFFVVRALKNNSENVTPAAKITTPVAPVPVRVTPKEAPKHAQLQITATPASAMLTLDGKTLGAVPYAGSFPIDDLPHRLVAKAEGHLPQETTVSLARDSVLHLNLDPVPPPPPAPAPVVRPPPQPEHKNPVRHTGHVRAEPVAPPPRPEPAAPVETKPKSNLSHEDPYQTEERRKLAPEDPFDREKPRIDPDDPWKK